MPISWADVEAIAPELSTVAGGTQAAILAYVGILLDETVLGDAYTGSAAYLAAHLATVGVQQAATAGLAAGVVPSSTKVGPLEQNYVTSSTGAMSRTALESTTYGRLYLLMSAVPRVSLGLVA